MQEKCWRKVTGSDKEFKSEKLKRELRFTSYDLKSTSYEFKSTRKEFKSKLRAQIQELRV